MVAVCSESLISCTLSFAAQRSVNDAKHRLLSQRHRLPLAMQSKHGFCVSTTRLGHGVQVAQVAGAAAARLHPRAALQQARHLRRHRHGRLVWQRFSYVRLERRCLQSEQAALVMSLCNHMVALSEMRQVL